MKILSKPLIRQPRLHIERGAPTVTLPDPAFVRLVHKWRAVRAELGLAKLLERGACVTR